MNDFALVVVTRFSQYTFFVESENIFFLFFLAKFSIWIIIYENFIQINEIYSSRRISHWQSIYWWRLWLVAVYFSQTDCRYGCFVLCCQAPFFSFLFSCSHRFTFRRITSRWVEYAIDCLVYLVYKRRRGPQLNYYDIHVHTLHWQMDLKECKNNK